VPRLPLGLLHAAGHADQLACREGAQDDTRRGGAGRSQPLCDEFQPKANFLAVGRAECFRTLQKAAEPQRLKRRRIRRAERMDFQGIDDFSSNAGGGSARI
jgi:hypothetical protein